ncbi:hypothetical protein EMIHUDRAFT_468865 [Emiliania huxleyi CCMP1516]|uniref:Uncharacterized protein n=2 Tax=Emiliania huxleyi TaxID=2903 RepID=A0A0D3JVD9_EMIH1|nr:hypothetical protein EMIHUDRAFT_468865 [Emiliania huxleyi CCMP1516]EOD27474.1 hypothetical protein EMIHUDRAFT_468865 [Emiliania huxleyi CCMP1516]|eukprot:XP_005779903.1 hypothetical protein EMIHUDRAFT_468865 [Emiliania huxleyi CCMP1516]
MSLALGDWVSVRGHEGQVRYFGATGFSEGMWAGIELQAAVGRNDGAVRGVRYFSCAPRHGLFVPASQCVKIDGPSDSGSGAPDLADAWVKVEGADEGAALKAGQESQKVIDYLTAQYPHGATPDKALQSRAIPAPALKKERSSGGFFGGRSSSRARVLVLHGGLSRTNSATLAQISAIDRRRPIPVAPVNAEDMLFFDLMWADPRAVDGVGLSAVRGAGCATFGPDITRRFCEINRLRMVIRSHEVPKSLSGVQVQHAGRLVTIFSASNYCGRIGNTGGTMLLTPALDYQLMEHWAPTVSELLVMEAEEEAEKAPSTPKENPSEKRKSFSAQANELMRADVLQKMKELDDAVRFRLFLGRYRDLKSTLAFFDPNEDGVVTYEELVLVDHSMGIPEASLKALAATLLGQGQTQLPTSSLLARLHVTYRDVTAEAADAAAEAAMLRLGGYEVDTLTDEQRASIEQMLLDLAAWVDQRKTGAIKYIDFIDAFRILEEPQDASTEAESLGLSLISQMMEQLCSLFYQHRWSLQRAFEYFDANGDGVLTPEEFGTALRALSELSKAADPRREAHSPALYSSGRQSCGRAAQASDVSFSLDLDERQLGRLVQALDRDGDGLINYDEFLTALEMRDVMEL